MCKVKGYVHNDDDEIEVKEYFLGFFLISATTAVEVRETEKMDSDG